MVIHLLMTLSCQLLAMVVGMCIRVGGCGTSHGASCTSGVQCCEVICNKVRSDSINTVAERIGEEVDDEVNLE